MKDATDFELATQCRNGNRAAFNEIVRRHQEKVYWAVRRIIDDPDDSMDIAQDVFVRAYQHIQDFRGDSQLSTWLYRIAMNLALNHLRKRKARTFFRLEDVEDTLRDGEDSPDEALLAAEQQALIRTAIDRLPAKQKQVFILRYYQEMPYEEMAKLFKKSTGGLKANYFHAVRKIQEFVTNALQK